MFNKILLPLPSEYFPLNAVKRVIQLAPKFKSKVYLEYIFEDQVMDKVDNVTSGAIPVQLLEEMAEEVKYAGVGSESTLFFDEIQNLAEDKNIEFQKIIHTGVHSDKILGCIKDKNIDLMVTEFRSDTLLKYRIFYDSPAPVWLEHSGRRIENICGILTNLSPNLLVPKFSFNLVRKFKVPMTYYYVIDDTEPYDREEELKNRNKLFSKIKRAGKRSGIEFKLETVENEISNFINQQFKNDESSLVILGRFTKPMEGTSVVPLATADATRRTRRWSKALKSAAP